MDNRQTKTGDNSDEQFTRLSVREVIVTDRVGGVHDFETLSTCDE